MKRSYASGISNSRFGSHDTAGDRRRTGGTIGKHRRIPAATSLLGQWTRTHNDESVLLSYPSIAIGPPLVEEFRPTKGATMTTMISVDGDRLIATH
jgi:hypothetical protein